MPEMDGLMLAEAIRHSCHVDPLPLVLLSSMGYRPQDERMTHFAASLSKPVKTSQLYNTLIGIFAGEAGIQVHRAAIRTNEQPVFDSTLGERLPLRILLAEDNATNQKLVLRLLERLGYRAD